MVDRCSVVAYHPLGRIKSTFQYSNMSVLHNFELMISFYSSLIRFPISFTLSKLP
jgi:hypothetical protein